METEFPALRSPAHKVLGTEFCSGYSDDYGEWNTGFYCPQSALSESSQLQAAVSCCGTPTYKYCCTATAIAINPTVISEEVITELSSSGFPSAGQQDPPMSASAADFGPFLIEAPHLVWSGIVCGAVMSIVFMLFAVCYYCSCCIFHQKRTAGASATASGLPLPLTAAAGATAESNLTLYRLGLACGTSSVSTIASTATTCSSGVGTSISSSLGSDLRSAIYSPSPSTIVNLSNVTGASLSSTSTPLLEILSGPGVGVHGGVSGRDFVYSPNQWQTESVYNNSSSGIYSNLSSSTYSYAYPSPSFVIQRQLCPWPESRYAYPNTNMSRNSAVNVNYNNWCYAGAPASLWNPDPPLPLPTQPPPYNYSQQVHGRVNNPIMRPQYSNRNVHEREPQPASNNRERGLRPTAAEIALYERILRVLLRNIDHYAGNSNASPRTKEQATIPRVHTHKARRASASEVSYQCDNENPPPARSLRAKSVNSIPIPDFPQLLPDSRAARSRPS